MEENNCAGCDKPLEGAVTTAIDKKWHADCFRCEACRGHFADGRFLAHSGRPYHKECGLGEIWTHTPHSPTT